MHTLSLSSGANVIPDLFDNYGGHTGESFFGRFFNRLPLAPTKNKTILLSPKEQIEKMRAIGLNISEIGAILSVTRQTVYGWLLESGKNPLRGKNQKRLNEVYQIFEEENISELDNVSKYFRQPIVAKKSLFDLLKETELHKDVICKALQKIQEKREQDKLEKEKHEEFLSKHGLFQDEKEHIKAAIKMHQSIR